MAAPSKGHKAIPLAKKVEIIKAVEEKKQSKTAIAHEFQVAKSTVSSILKNKRKTLEAFESSTFRPDRKRLRTAAHTDVEEALLLWFKQARSQGVPVSGPILQLKARELAAALGHRGFRCSTGWLERFKTRHGIAFRQMSGEATSVTNDMTADWLEVKLPALLREYQPVDIFNADKTGLFWKCLPDKTLHMKGEQCSGGKKSKERITVLVCANMTGTEKLPLLVIGKFAKQRCFKNVSRLPVQYEANRKAWMISDLFSSWLMKLDREFVRAGRKIVLLIDNCPAHPNIAASLKAVNLVFLPPNTTAKLQPCDQGIIQNLKVQYRKYLLIKLISAIEAKEDFAPTLLDALYLLRLSWENVSAQTIANCFHHSGFTLGSSNATPEADTTADGSALLHRLGTTEFELPTEVSFESFVAVDSDVITTETLTDEDIASIVQKEDTVSVMGSDEDAIDDSPVPPPPPSAREADRSLAILRRYFESNNALVGEEFFKVCAKLEKTIGNDLISACKQTKITDFMD